MKLFYTLPYQTPLSIKDVSLQSVFASLLDKLYSKMGAVPNSSFRKDIVWMRTEHEVKTVGDLNTNTEVFNLFDGIITLTQTLSRDSWVRKVFDF